jgi:CRP-like cAMP-binding protein
MNPAPRGNLPGRCATCAARMNCCLPNLSTEVLKQFHEITFSRIYNPDVTVFRQGEQAHGLFIVRSGSIRLAYISTEGRSLALGLVGPSGILGLAEIMTGIQYSVSAETLEESDLEYVEKQQFLAFLAKNPIVAVELLRMLSHQLQRFQTELCEVAGRLPSTQRLLHTLQDFSETCGLATREGVRIRLCLTVQDLADRIGCSRQWTSKLLHDLESQGLIHRRGGWITLTDITGVLLSHAPTTSSDVMSIGV